MIGFSHWSLNQKYHPPDHCFSFHMLFFGCFIVKDKQKDFLERVEYTLRVEGVFAEVAVDHHIRNTENEPITGTLALNLDDECAVTGFVVTTDRRIESVLREKEEAKRDVADAVASGHAAHFVDKADDLTFSVTVGTLQPAQTAVVRVTYVTRLTTRGGRLVATLPDTPARIPFTLTADGSAAATASGALGEAPTDVELPGSGAGIAVMRDDELGETTACAAFVNTESVGAVDVVFLCDRSGSMSGAGIAALRETLQLFLRQLPPGARFNIVSFGSSFDGLYDAPVAYTDESLAFCTRAVAAFNANYGGTVIDAPLKALLTGTTQVIVLTDGQVGGAQKADILAMLRANEGRNVVHAIGLGRDVDEKLVRDIARTSGGLSAISRDPGDLRRIVAGVVERIVRPAVSAASVTFAPPVDVVPGCVRTFTGELAVYARVPDTLGDAAVGGLTATLTGVAGEQPVTWTVGVTQRTRGSLLGQALAAQEIKRAEAADDKAAAVKLSLRYGVLSRYTTFVAIDPEKHEVADVKVVDLDAENNQRGGRVVPAVGGGNGLLCCMDMCAPRMVRTKCARGGRKEEKGECVKRRKSSERHERMAEAERTPCSDELFECSVSSVKRETCGVVRERGVMRQEAPMAAPQAISVFDRLVLLQKADGRFEGVDGVVGSECVASVMSTCGVDRQTAETLIGIAVLQVFFAARKTEWRLLVEKATRFVAHHGGEHLVPTVVELVKPLKL